MTLGRLRPRLWLLAYAALALMPMAAAWLR